MDTIRSIVDNPVLCSFFIYGVIIICVLGIIALAILGLDKRERDIRSGSLMCIVMIIVGLIGFLLVTAQLTKNNDTHWQPILKNIQQTCRLQWDGGLIDAKNGLMTINSFLGNPAMTIPLRGEIKFERDGVVYVLDVAKCRGVE
jgi:hypothetical protein